MPVFSPEFSKIFKIAAYTNMVSSTPVVIFRFTFIVVSTFLIAYSILTNNIKGTYFGSSLLTAILMFEAFYHLKVLESKADKGVRDVSQKGNVAESLELSAARLLLKSSSWTKVSAILKSLLKDRKIKVFFEKAGFNRHELDSLVKASANDTVDIQKLFTKTMEFTKKEETNHIDQLDLLLALFSESNALKQSAFAFKLKEKDLLNIAFWVRHLFEKQRTHFWEKAPTSFGLGFASAWEGGWTLETEKFTKNISLLVQGGKNKNHLVGRQDVILQVEEILSRSDKRRSN